MFPSPGVGVKPRTTPPRPVGPVSADYQNHATRQHAVARSAYAKWTATLTPDQRANLSRLGVFAPDDSHEVGGHSPMQVADIADSPLARVDPDFAAAIDSEIEIIADRFGVNMATARKIAVWHAHDLATSLFTREADLLAVVVGGLLASKNVRISSAGLAFASSMASANGLGSQAEYSRTIGVSRTIISKSVKAWQRQLNLHTSPFQKSEAACETYSQVAKDQHWRTQKATAVKLRNLRKP